MISKINSNKISNMSFLCAVLIVGVHLDGAYVKGSGSWWMHEFFSLGVCPAALQFFFIVSGYFLAERMGEEGWWRNALRKRLLSLVVPFYLWSLAFLVCVSGKGVVINLLRGNPLLSGFDFQPDLTRILQFLGLDVFAFPELRLLWYVRAIMIFILISPVLKRFPLWSVIVLGLGMIVGGPFLQHDLMSPSVFFFRWGGFPLSGAFYFAVGVYLSLAHVKMTIGKRTSVICLSVGLIAFAIKSILVYTESPCFYVGLMGVPLVLIGFWGMMSEAMWPRGLVENSFAIYLVHTFILVGYTGFGGGAYCHSPVWFVTIWMLAVMASLAVARIIRMNLIVSKCLFGGR